MKSVREVAWIILPFALASVFFAAAIGPAAGKSKKGKYPYAWGMLSGNSGCVIFADTRHTKTDFVGVARVRWWGTLDVIETHNYDMKQRQWMQTRASLDELQKLAIKDKLKLIKIPAEHSGKQLEEAREMCGAGSR